MKKTILLILFLAFKPMFSQQIDAYIGEVQLFAGNFAPNGWAFCNGQIISIQQNSALFSLLGTQYGGNGQTNFALPDLRGRVPVGQGQGASLTARSVGDFDGQENVSISIANLPSHNHNASLSVSNQNGTVNVPLSDSSIAVSSIKSGRSTISNLVFNTSVPDILLGNSPTTSSGNSQPLNIIKPYQCINYIIALQGIYPSRN